MCEPGSPQPDNVDCRHGRHWLPSAGIQHMHIFQVHRSMVRDYAIRAYVPAMRENDETLDEERLWAP